MPDRLPTIDVEPRVRRRAAGAERATEAEVLALAARAARLRDGFAALEQAPLECLAVLLGVEPRTIERVRAALEDPALRGEAALEAARAEGKRAGTPPAPPQPPPAPRDAGALLRAAREREGGLAILLDAAPECAAILFGVHPELVARAREDAARAPHAGSAPAR